jgi:hypothetical protein
LSFAQEDWGHPVIYIVILAPLVAFGLWFWHKVEREEQNPRWLLQIGISVGACATFLFIDTLIGHLFNPSLPLLDALGSTGPAGIGIDIFVPGWTILAFAGWTRSLVLCGFCPLLRQD